MQPKPRVPPFRDLPRLLELQKEKQIRDETLEKRAKKKAEQGNKSDSEGEDDLPYDKEDPHKYDDLNQFDFPFDEFTKEHIVNFNDKDITLYEIFQEYGTSYRPKINPKFDPQPPVKEEKPAIVKQPTVSEQKEDGEENKEEAKVEEEPEEVFVPVCEKVLFYDFATYDRKDPILLALMIKGENDEFTL